MNPRNSLFRKLKNLLADALFIYALFLPKNNYLVQCLIFLCSYNSVKTCIWNNKLVILGLVLFYRYTYDIEGKLLDS
jgi:hypothetical protein